jgi:NtrC-family two-component system sensor histidine kinase KinB
MKSRVFHSRLRTRLFVSLLPFVVILLAAGLYAIALFSHLANSVDLAVTRHYQSIFAAQVMSQSLAGMEREAQPATDTRTGENKLFAEYRQRFEDNLALQRNTVTTPGLKELNDQLATNYVVFLKALAAPDALRAPKERPGDPTAASILTRMNALLEKVREQNYQAVLATSNRIQQSARDVTRLVIIGMMVVLTITAYICYRLGRSILRPIQLLTRATHDLGEGYAAQPVPVVSHDELGELAVSFNKMAAQLEEYRRNTSEEIIRLHRTMETTLATFPDPIFVLNQAGQVELKNPAAEDLAAALNRNGQLPERLQTVARKALDTGENYLPHSYDEAVSYRLNGAEKSFLPRILAMHDKDNALFGVAVVLYDVTRFRLLDSAKSNLVATVSHELNTPLTSVRMALHLLLEKSVGRLTAKQEELLQAARNDTERLLRILNDLLDLARLEEGNDGLRKERISPAELLRTVIEDTAEKISPRGLRINCRIEPDLPDVAVDRQRISHAFNNLIANAIKYSPAGGEIRLDAARAEDDTVEFSITDEGPGIPEEYHARIFERFFRAPGQTKTGAGLGLSIAREIAVAHGGRIGVKSAPGHGSTFFVMLKAAEAVRSTEERH